MQSDIVGAFMARERGSSHPLERERVASRLPIGLAGCGEWGRHILRDLSALGCEVHVVARSDASRRRAEEGGAASVVSSVDLLPDVEGAVVATATVTHAEVAEALLRRDIAVFVEKPLTSDLGQARRLAQLAPERLFVMDKWRYHPGIELLAQLARTGELGRPVGLRTTRVAWGHRFADVDTVWIHAPHDLAISLEVLGAILPARSAVAERMDGTVAGLVGVLGDEPWHVLEVSALSAERRREIRLVCDEGSAWLADAYADSIAVAPVGRKPERRQTSTELPLLRELRAFVSHLRGGPPPRSSAAEGVEAVARIEELRRLAGL
jgi:predicted dehydrogenase